MDTTQARMTAIGITALLLAAACAAPAPASAPRASAAPTPAPVVASASAPVLPTFTPVGKFALSPATGPWGTEVVATAQGLAPATAYEVVWTTVAGSWALSPDRSEYIGREYKPIEQKLISATTDANGAFAAKFKVPDDFGYQHDVLVKRGGETVNKSAFDIDMVTTITPSSGPAGTPITVEVKGIGYRAYQNSFQLSYDNKYTGWVSSVTTKGYAKVVIPAAGNPGAHYIQLGHAETGAPYLNPQQQPVVASRPFPRIPFTLTDGPAVLPPDVAQQKFSAIPARPVDQGIWTEPYGAFVGDPAMMRGKALKPNSEVEITWSAMVGNRSVTGFQHKVTTVGTARTDAAGVLAWPFKIPDDLGGVHEMTAKIGGEIVAKTDLYILSNAFPISVDRGPSGTLVKLQMKGVGWTETEQIYHMVVDNAFAGYACAFQSKGDITINTVMSGDPGWHFVDLYPGIYSGKEKRPFNYKMPQLTALDDHPGERMPVYRFAFQITSP
jgi:hypothetical protein